MENWKKLLKKYWILGVIEVSIVVIYWIVNPVAEDSKFNIFISPEILATILVGVGAIYSWLSNKSDRERDENLNMLKDIDEIGKYYKDKPDERNINNRLQNHIDDLEQIEGYKGTFLETYLLYIKDKMDPSKNEEEQFKSSKSVIFVSDDEISSETVEKVSNFENSNRENDFSKLSLHEIKDKISKTYDTSVNNIKYSKNYIDYTQENNFKWTTWYSLRESFIKNVEDDAKLIFFTNIDGRYTGVSILGKNLKDLSQKMKYRNKKSGDPQFDFYITKNEDGSFFENRNELPLDKYGVKSIDF
ncbi:hypothetical protein [Streptococcus himalayensis]|uniref:Uncharacterized protein n=1 Tax=Streptococcus himalayensis TaxID=1888195 RepID=A0A917EI03_9STRE|nr:hypothetical protein [Streptococcus himalayensis]GGE37295.1 hypothetical protein GCM10011510_18270 [Streptococcus himalayensis]